MIFMPAKAANGAHGISEASFSHELEVSRERHSTLPRRTAAKFVLVSSFIFAGRPLKFS